MSVGPCNLEVLGWGDYLGLWNFANWYRRANSAWTKSYAMGTMNTMLLMCDAEAQIILRDAADDIQRQLHRVLQA